MTQYVNLTDADPVDPNPPPAASWAPPDDIGPSGAVVPAHTPRWGQWVLPRTLTARLVSGVVCLIVFVSLVTGVGTYYFLHGFLYSRLDQQVQAQSATLAAQFRHNLTGADNCDPTVGMCVLVSNASRSPGPPTSDRDPFLTIVLDTGVSRLDVTRDRQFQTLKLSTSAAAKLVRSGGTHSITTTDGHAVRVSVQTVPALNGTFTVISGLSSNEVTGTLHQLVLREIAVGGVGVVLALVLSYLGLTLGLGPLKRVTRTAQEVTAELSADGSGLERRVPETDSQTEVGQLATSFNTMLDTVQTEFTARRESEERMRQFLADASHELRTPLTSIRGYAELARMQRVRSGQASDDPDDTIGRIETEGTRMSRLVEDLLILARGDDPNDNSTERDVVALDEVVEDAITDLKLGYPERTVTTDIQPGLQVLGDRDQLLRLVRNLTGNAAVHTDPEGPIRVTAQRDGDNVVVQVIDAGPGLPPEEAAHVFERFWRADRARTRVRGGSGLGMAIVAQIVSAHGGRAFFDSGVPQGSTVTVVLPALP